MDESRGVFSPSPHDRAVVAAALGRTPYEFSAVAARCPFGYPAVVETPPVVGEGSPNPTLLYLVCPALVKVVSRAESAGAVKRLRELARSERQAAFVLGEVNRLYRAKRVALLEAMVGKGGGHFAGDQGKVARGPRVWGAAGAARLQCSGVGGQAGAELASCLHAYAAAWLAILSGWLSSEESAATTLAQQVEALWQVFLPPLKDCWCKNSHCKQWVES